MDLLTYIGLVLPCIICDNHVRQFFYASTIFMFNLNLILALTKPLKNNFEIEKTATLHVSKSVQ